MNNFNYNHISISGMQHKKSKKRIWYKSEDNWYISQKTVAEFDEVIKSEWFSQLISKIKHDKDMWEVIGVTEKESKKRSEIKRNKIIKEAKKAFDENDAWLELSPQCAYVQIYKQYA